MINSTFFEGQVLWTQIDANRHLRHSAYADFAAQARSNMLDQYGLTAEKFEQLQIGPILFKEELQYHREITMNEHIRVDVQLQTLDVAKGRFSIIHQLFQSDNKLAATIHIDGAWLNLKTRKLCNIPKEWYSQLYLLPKSNKYTEIHESSEH